MDLFQTLILSFVEGVTEFLPISSTGHLVLTSQILNIPQTEFVKSFEIIIQLGAILAVVLLYFRTLLNTKIWPKIFVAFLPSAFVGLLFYKIIKDILIGNSLIIVIALFLGGIAFILVEYWHKNLPAGPLRRSISEASRQVNKTEIASIEQITLKNAFIIGLFQSISVIPGVSRAGATILGALLLKTNRKTAAEFSFILAVPTMFAATGLDIFQTKLNFSGNELLMLAIGFMASFFFAAISVKLLIKYLSNHSFVVFGVYRITIAIIFYIIFLK